MILEEGEVLSPEYLPFPVAQQNASQTAFERTSGILRATRTRSLQTAAACPSSPFPDGGTSLEEVERAFVEMAMTQANGNQTHAARLLDISRDALRYKLKKFGLMHAEEEESSTAST